MDDSHIPRSSDEIERRFAECALTNRERDAARSALCGMTAMAAARVMGVSASTVGSLRQRAYSKLGVRGMAELSEKDDNPSADATSVDVAMRAALLARGLSKTQAEVLALVATGLSSAEIAKSLSIALGTVSSARANGYRLLGIHSREELMSLLDEEAEAPRRRCASRLAFACVVIVMVFAVAIALGERACHSPLRAPSDEAVVTDFKVNDRGQTYGSVEDIEVLVSVGNASLSDNLPDLVRVRGNSGEDGYVFTEDMLRGGGGREIPVFEQDGVTIVDTFTVS